MKNMRAELAAKREDLPHRIESMSSTFRLLAMAMSLSAMLTANQLNAQTNLSTNTFVEVSRENSVYTFDLRTLHMIDPGRFTIAYREIDQPDVMNFKLKVVDTLRTYCDRDDGHYSAPTSLFFLGAPELPVQPIVVTSNRKNVETLGAKLTKSVEWKFPYKRFTLKFSTATESFQDDETVFCDEPQGAKRSRLLNGLQFKILYDCRRALVGHLNFNDDLSKVIIGRIWPNSVEEALYFAACRRVTGKEPYQPN
jgi:hypothetical protein